jgi:hypothetical protein
MPANGICRGCVDAQEGHAERLGGFGIGIWRCGERRGGGERRASERTLNCPSWSATTTWPLMAFATTALLFFLRVPEPTRDVRSPACAQGEEKKSPQDEQVWVRIDESVAWQCCIISGAKRGNAPESVHDMLSGGKGGRVCPKNRKGGMFQPCSRAAAVCDTVYLPVEESVLLKQWASR